MAEAAKQQLIILLERLEEGLSSESNDQDVTHLVAAGYDTTRKLKAAIQTATAQLKISAGRAAAGTNPYWQ